jgi:hypothetical protein
MLTMYDYRLFFAHVTLDDRRPHRRPTIGHGDAQRVYRLDSERRESRDGGRR